MVLTVRCYQCGENAVRLIMAGRQIMQARCRACGANVLAEILALEQDTQRAQGDDGLTCPDRDLTPHQLPAIERDSEEGLHA